jgi:hypothetical protein
MRVCKSSISASAAAIGCLLGAYAPVGARAQDTAGVRSAVGAIGAGSTLVHSKFGGQIFGFDIDQNGTEGVLSEDKQLQGTKVLSAVETFDQATGKILKLVKKLETQDNFVTLGVTGASIGLVEHEHVPGIYVTKRIYEELNPLASNAFTGKWTAPLKADDIILGVSRNQGAGSTAFLTYHNTDNGNSFVFGSTVGANIFGPRIPLRNPVFQICCGPVIGYDSVTNEAVIASSTGEVGGPPPVFALANLKTKHVVQFNGLPGPPPTRAGFVNGLAVDSGDGIACTTTELDARVEFYDLKKKTGFAVVLPGSGGQQLNSGADVEFDPLNKLFLVAQPVSSTGGGNSSIQVYDTKGKFVESLNGFNFSNASNVIGTHIGLNPGTRSGYVNGPDSGATELQSFTY